MAVSSHGVRDRAAWTSARLRDALSNPHVFPHPVTTLEIVETHISWVILTGEYVYKVKKPVNLGFLDFSSLEKRRFYCNEEIRLNQRLSPDLYVDVLANFLVAVETMLVEAGEIQETEVHRFLQLVHVVLIDDHRRDMGLDQLDPIHVMIET